MSCRPNGTKWPFICWYADKNRVIHSLIHSLSWHRIYRYRSVNLAPRMARCILLIAEIMYNTSTIFYSHTNTIDCSEYRSWVFCVWWGKISWIDGIFRRHPVSWIRWAHLSKQRSVPMAYKGAIQSKIYTEWFGDNSMSNISVKNIYMRRRASKGSSRKAAQKI